MISTIKKNTIQLVCLALFLLFGACKDGKTDEEQRTISITQQKDLSGTYILQIEQKKGTGSEFITSHNPSVINQEIEIELLKNKNNTYNVELKQFSIAAPTAIYDVVYNTFLDTTYVEGKSFSATFEKEKQEKIDTLFSTYKKLQGHNFLYERTGEGNFIYTSGKVDWAAYDNDLRLREDPQAEFKKYIIPDYLTMLLNESFNYTEGKYILNEGLETFHKGGEAKLRIDKGEFPDEYVIFNNKHEKSLQTTVRNYFKGTEGKWSKSEIINTRITPHKINGINTIITTITTIEKVNIQTLQP
ncbi:hypothetical protein [Marixanthomonas spongiae]|uniref:Lipoprotein n=1 Tax=Marixanthomonas spongiae TaxID=2174845 RepID=A0A2U0I103_9FLAO|nr:hypothetical protein [Marixanthomonas spongiae]PVW14779.1 hypothetical protein DDV96_09700 [Marixanthomonas spongiae]